MSNYVFRPNDFIRSSCVIDVVSSTVIYYGYYHPNTTHTTTGPVVDPAIAQFQIMKETRDVSGNTIKLQYADIGFNQIWNNRASLTYL